MLQESLKTPTNNMQVLLLIVDLNQLDNHLILKISDDGVGFNVYQKKNWTTKHYLQNK
jgi:signal transduction histidine kinase